MKFTVDNAIDKNLKIMQTIFDEETEDSEILLPKLSTSIFKRDYHYLVDPGKGRLKTPTTEDDRSFFNDPWSSFFVEFVMRGRKTGIPEFNEMYRDVRAYIERQHREKTEEWVMNMEPKFTEIIKSHNNHHPEDQYVDSDPISSLSSANE
jgi:hypothetical protein